MVEVSIINRSSNPMPRYATPLSAGLDIQAELTEPITLVPLQRATIPTGIFIQLPDGYEAQIRPRSGLAAKHGITVVNAPGTIDPDYRGEILVALINLSNLPFMISPGERIAQMIIAPFSRVELKPTDNLSPTLRGDGGFGHTGR
jgi:dUTP pyrophosphatase